MKIAVDARELAGRATGVGRYLSELLTEWSDSSDARRHDWRLYCHRDAAVPGAFGAALRILPGRGGTAWEQWTLARALSSDPPDVLFAPGYTAPLRPRCRGALVVHDVAFAARPEWFSWREGTRRRVLTRLSARRARLVLTDSGFARDEIVRHLGVSVERVRVIPLGVRAAEATRRSPVPREPVVLFVGSIFQRRHVDVLIRAFSSIVAPRVSGSRLEVVGEDRSHPACALARLVTMQSLDAQRRISIRSYVDDGTLRELYAAASVFAFPSEYEGFGLTPLEALAAGVPPVVLSTPVAFEIYGAAARYVAPSSSLEADLGDAIVALLTNDAARQDVLRAAPSVLARYRWEKTAAETLAALREAAHG